MNKGGFCHTPVLVPRIADHWNPTGAPRTCLALGRKSLESLLGPGGSVLRRSAIKAMLMDNATWIHLAMGEIPSGNLT